MEPLGLHTTANKVYLLLFSAVSWYMNNVFLVLQLGGMTMKHIKFLNESITKLFYHGCIAFVFAYNTSL